MQETFDERRVRRLLDLLQPKRLTRVLDIGANPLDAPPYAGLLAMGGCEVWGFEPQAEAHAQLVAKASRHEHYLPYAVGDGTTMALYVCGNSTGFTSTLEPDPAFPAFCGQLAREMAVTEVVEMETHRLDDLDLPQIDLVKIDIQGGEVTVFENGRNVLAEAQVVITEVALHPMYRNQPLLDEVMRCLRESGYGLHRFLFLKDQMLQSRTGGKLRHGAASQALDGDVAFLRAPEGLQGMTDEGLKHLAILADSVLGSFDLAGQALDLLCDRGVLEEGALGPYRREMALPHRKGLRLRRPSWM